mgnify:CR=1 FL=1
MILETKTDYEAFNEAFGDADVSDEEDAIQNENDDTKSGKSKLQNKYEKQIKSGMAC